MKSATLLHLNCPIWGNLTSKAPMNGKRMEKKEKYTQKEISKEDKGNWNLPSLSCL